MTKIYVGKSKIAGRGLFAKRSIKKGEIVFIMKGDIMKLNPRNRDKIFSNPNVVGIDKDTWINPRPPYVYINHSCDPTVGVRGRVTYVALRDISKGEEITFDYSISEDSSWYMRCNCGSKNCRKVIRSIRFLPPEFFKKYLSAFPTYFRNLYTKQVLNKDGHRIGVK
jgi:hypothetical protein